MKCPNCGTKLVNVYTHDSKTKSKKPIGKFCYVCVFVSDLTNLAKKVQQKRKRDLNEKRKFPDFKKKHKTKCGKCGSIRSVVIRKIPHTKARKERGETPSWSGTCKKCGHYWTQNFDY